MGSLGSCSGGIRLGGHKEESCQTPLQIPALPRILIYPLTLSGGGQLLPTVGRGERVLRGQVIAALQTPLVPALHASTSGRIIGTGNMQLPRWSGLGANSIVIETDGEDEAGVFRGVTRYADLEPETLRDLIGAAGIVGLGGGAFPTAVKLSPGQWRPIETLLLNGAECDPYITCDDSLMRHFPSDILHGAMIIMHVLGAKRCVLAVKDDRSEAFEILKKTRTKGNFPGIDLITVPAIYPIGSEKQLVKVITGREVPAGGIPADVGVVCQNVGTAAAVYRAITTGEPLMSRIVTVTGEGVARPQNLLARIGTPIGDLVQQCGGYTEQAHRLMVGGSMMGISVPSDELPITASTNCILVAGPGDVMVGKSAVLPCIRCGACATACPINLLPQELYWYVRAGRLARAMDYHLPDCIECGCCDYVCPSHIPLVQTFRSARIKAAAKAVEREKAHHARIRFEARQARLERERLEKAENARRKKDLLGKGSAIPMATGQPKSC